MKTKLQHLFFASLISLCFIFSTTSNVFSALRLSEVSSEVSTTSASGFDTGNIKQKVENGGTYVGKFDPGIYLLFDLEIDVVRINSETVEVTMRNKSQAIIDDSFWMTFFVTVPNNSNGLDGFLWQNKYDIPGPLSEKTIQISSSEIGYLDSANHWKFKAFSFAVPGDFNLTNNSDTVCNYEGNCP